MRRATDIFQHVSDDTITTEYNRYLSKSNDFDGCSALADAWRALANLYGFEFEVISD